MDDNLLKVLIGLTTILGANLLISLGKGVYSQYRFYMALIAEIDLLRKTIKGNGKRILTFKTPNSFPILTELEPLIHLSKMEEIILDKDIANSALKVIQNSKHYNRIIELGEKNPKIAKRKQEVLHQGGILSNDPEVIRKANHEKYVGQLDEYRDLLVKKASKSWYFLIFFPWYLVLTLNSQEAPILES